jgi:hypothetical protein
METQFMTTRYNEPEPQTVNWNFQPQNRPTDLQEQTGKTAELNREWTPINANDRRIFCKGLLEPMVKPPVTDALLQSGTCKFSGCGPACGCQATPHK